MDILEELSSDHDDSLPLTIAAQVEEEELRVEILERGRPMASGDRASDPTRRTNDYQQLVKFFDAIRWKQIVPIGSELYLHRSLAKPKEEAPPPAPANTRAELAPEQEYCIRRFQDGDALKIARSIYAAYGRTYLDADLYSPERITELNRDGKLCSVVAEAENGDIVGHYALERPNPERPAESGQAVVDQAHRRRGLMEKMRTEATTWARELNLPGFFGRATARHAASQRADERLGAVPTGLFLAYSPASMRLRRDPAVGSGDRPSSVVYWTALQPIPPSPCFLYEGTQSLTEPILKSLGLTDLRTSSGPDPEHTADKGEAAIHTHFWLGRGLASLMIQEVSRASRPALRQACADLLAMEPISSVVLHLPLDDPHTPWLTRVALEDLGFKVAAILPFDIPGNRHGLILEYTRAQVDTGGLDLESEVARNLLAAAVEKRENNTE